ncbi:MULTISPECIES: 4-hydroxythreonine-4-phosphate dehydrogenase PdxA [unclassified Halorhodospira]|uniref:4-hydroxythreonine-4-phosphate dehydrogenase PdxA n=1 Tax=unclassified Halorhodospira TaxID=2626748 RepID=UPI001EE83866|nr:4-hydroxythreonine-4-phosphate dehydrogenase PdxA [Halorhodospira sp. M39old]MCG5546972.1 4-hydroxythreonine-4-phosphate dehydrogenase PdxA [Halorhodospira sp. M38]
MSDGRPRIAVTCGEPAGIGYELVAAAAMRSHAAELVAIGDPALLRERSRVLDASELATPAWSPETPRAAHRAGCLPVDPVRLARPAHPGTLDPANAEAVVASLRRAVRLAAEGQVDGIVTAPVHKGVINDAGIPFSGHTELLAELTATETPVMMLVAGELRVALATTHMALHEVPSAITPERLEAVITALHHDLVDKFAIAAPRILVTGLNPHAGEGGHLGREELEVIEPTLERLRDAGLLGLVGPLPADTAFTPRSLEGADAVLAMYHDQGLPVLKHAGFGRAVNVTLGLPIVRTSVDHGTALELAGTGRADGGSLQAAIELAADLALRRQHRPG